MAAEIFDMAYVGEMPWHGLGTKVDGGITGQELKEVLNLSDVTLRHLFTTDRDGMFIRVPEKKAVVRAKDDIVLGVVGDGFNPVQDAGLIDTFDTLRQEGLCHFETAGLLKGGSRFFVMMTVPGGILKLRTPNGKVDMVYQYLAASHGHDGTLRLEITPTNVRVVCQNTVNLARAQARKEGVTFAIKHTLNAEQRVEAAIRAYKAAMEYQQDYAAMAQKMVDTQFSFENMKILSERMYPTPEGKESNLPGATLKGRYELQRLFIEGVGHIELGLAGTAWGAYNAVTEYLDWQRPTRGDKDWTEQDKRNKKWEASQFAPAIVEQKMLALNTIEELIAL